MQRHNSFKLSAITVAVFGIATQSYAAECELPIKIDNQKGATVANCNIKALEFI